MGNDVAVAIDAIVARSIREQENVVANDQNETRRVASRAGIHAARPISGRDHDQRRETYESSTVAIEAGQYFALGQRIDCSIEVTQGKRSIDRIHLGSLMKVVRYAAETDIYNSGCNQTFRVLGPIFALKCGRRSLKRHVVDFQKCLDLRNPSFSDESNMVGVHVVRRIGRLVGEFH